MEFVILCLKASKETYNSRVEKGHMRKVGSHFQDDPISAFLEPDSNLTNFLDFFSHLSNLLVSTTLVLVQ